MKKLLIPLFFLVAWSAFGQADPNAFASTNTANPYSAPLNQEAKTPLRIHCIRCPHELGPQASYTDTLMCQERFFRAEIDANHYDAAIMWLLAEWVNYQVACQTDITPTVTLEQTGQTLFVRKEPDFAEFMSRLIAQFPTLSGE